MALPFDVLLLALGRVANTEGYGLEALGIGTSETASHRHRRVPADQVPQHLRLRRRGWARISSRTWRRTRRGTPRSTRCSDRLRRFKADYRAVPWATFTDPQVARVGLSEEEARRAGTPYTVSTYRLDDLDRAIADGETHGFVKVLTRPGTDVILGATCVGTHAAETIAEFVLAMTHGLGLGKVLGTIHIYPTFAEANKHVAGAWKRGTVTPGQERLPRGVSRLAAGSR